MLRLIQTHDLLSLAYAQADGVLDDIEYDGHGDRNPSDDCDYAENLNAEEVEAAAVEYAERLNLSAIIVSEQAGKDGAQCAVDAVHADSADRIIDLELLIDKFDTEYNGKACADTDDNRTERSNHIAACGDGYQTCQRAIQRHRNVRLLVADPGDAHNGNGCNSSCHVGGYKYTRCNLSTAARQCNGRAAVEAEPAEPQDKAAECAERQGVTRNRTSLAVLGVLTDTGTEDGCTDQSGNAADHMYRRGACEIMEAKLCEPAAAPDPVTGNRVNDRRNNHRVNAVCREFSALCHRTGNDGRGSCTEYGLEDQSRPVVALTDNAVREEIKAAEERACRTEHDAEAKDPEDRRAEREVHQVLHNDVAGILCSGEAGLNHCEAGLHEEYQRRRNKRPAYVHRRSKFHDIHF